MVGQAFGLYASFGGLRGIGIGKRIFAVKGISRIQGESIRDIGKIANKLSQYESRLGLDELKALEKLVQKHGGNLRYDLNPVKGKFLHPHVQIENLTPSIKSRHIWLGEDAIKYLQKQ